MKRPWMPLYVGDYLSDTGHLTTLQHGAYLLLMMHYWAKGRLPSDEKQLMAIARLCQSDWDGNRDILASFFERGWRHARIESELANAKSISEKRSLAGLKGAWAKHGKPMANAWQMPTHSHSHIERKDRPKKPTVEQAEAAKLAMSDELKSLMGVRGLTTKPIESPLPKPQSEAAE